MGFWQKWVKKSEKSLPLPLSTPKAEDALTASAWDEFINTALEQRGLGQLQCKTLGREDNGSAYVSRKGHALNGYHLAVITYKDQDIHKCPSKEIKALNLLVPPVYGNDAVIVSVETLKRTLGVSAQCAQVAHRVKESLALGIRDRT